MNGNITDELPQYKPKESGSNISLKEKPLNFIRNITVTITCLLIRYIA
jgi:hypothetical protein